MLLRVKDAIGKVLSLGSLEGEVEMSFILIWVEERDLGKMQKTKELTVL